MQLIRSLAKENVDPVERHGPAADNCASCYGAPEDIATGKIPDSQQRREYRHEDAQAGNPERDASHQAGIQKTTSWPHLLRVGQPVFSRASKGIVTSILVAQILDNLNRF